MFNFAVGALILAASVAAFLQCLPRGDQVHRLVNTRWEPYLAVVLTSGFGLGTAMIIASIGSLIG